LGPPLYGRYWDLSTDEQEDFEQLVSALPARDRAPTGPSAQARQRGLNEPLPCLARGGAGPERR
ncbi:MAG TPA: hypothetical protein VEY69_10480, partial [Lautropia sp.]|nr:hypothetical protein [Lautropia sp.]